MRTKIEERISFPWPIKEQLLKETNGRCAHCGTPLDRYANLTVEHVIPLNKGGTNDIENLTVLCEEDNKEKSDMILSVAWYPYLTTKKRKVLEQQMAEYMTETDYLSEDCLMPLDMFRIEVPVTPQRKTSKGIRVIRMPVYIQGIRIDKEEAFDWLMEYRRSLQFRESVGTIQHPSDWPAPCYLLKKGNLEVAMVNPYMIHEWDDDLKNYRNEIFMDWFFSPDLKNSDYLPETLSYLVSGVEDLIKLNITKTMKTGACAVLFRMRCFVSDRFCEPVFDLLADGRKDKTREFKVKESTQSIRIRDLGVVHIMGEKEACKAIKQRLLAENSDGQALFEDVMKENKQFNARF